MWCWSFDISSASPSLLADSTVRSPNWYLYGSARFVCHAGTTDGRKRVVATLLLLLGVKRVPPFLFDDPSEFFLFLAPGLCHWKIKENQLISTTNSRNASRPFHYKSILITMQRGIQITDKETTNVSRASTTFSSWTRIIQINTL